LAYIDPPYRTQKNWGDFNDTWNGMDDYLAFMKPRIQEIHRVLKPTGTMYLHADQHASHYLKVLIDEVFGYNNFLNEIAWKRASPQSNSKIFPPVHDAILVHAKNAGKHVFNPQFKPLKQSSIDRHNLQDERGRYFEMTVTRPVRDPANRQMWKLGLGERQPATSREYAFTRANMKKLLASGELYKNKHGSIVRRYYLVDCPGSPVSSIWDDIHHVMSKESVQYATQKPEKLMERVITASSRPGDMVLDAFAGSGTTCAVAQKLGRNSVCIDVNPKACKIMEVRLQ